MLRYRNLLAPAAARLKNRAASILMESGVEYVKERLHHKKYFLELLTTLPEQVGEAGESVAQLLRLNREALEWLTLWDRRLLAGLERDARLRERVQLLQSIDAVGQVLSLTWALEVGEPGRLGSIRKAISFCGLCSGRSQSGEVSYRMPLSKQRNKHLQTVLMEVAKLAPQHSPELKEIDERERLGP